MDTEPQPDASVPIAPQERADTPEEDVDLGVIGSLLDESDEEPGSETDEDRKP